MTTAILDQPPLTKAVNTDASLLRQYITQSDRAALAELVQRYASLVYSAALRQMRDESSAQDVMQIVFVTFAQKAGKIRSAHALAAWLLRTTHYTAANMIKTENRRKRQEQRAAIARSEILQSDSEIADERWQSLSPLIDRAMLRLTPEDQNAVVLRYFRNLSLDELSQSLGTSKDTARKRVNRAIDRLRKILLRAGAHTDTCSADSLAILISTRAVLHAPTSAVSVATHSASVAMLSSKAAGITFGLTAAKFAAAVLFLIGATVAAVKLSSAFQAAAPISQANPTTQNIQSLEQPAATQPENSDWKTAFYATYCLKPGERIKYIAPFYIPEHTDWYTSRFHEAPDLQSINWRAINIFYVDADGKGNWRMGGLRPNIQATVFEVAKLRNWQFSCDPNLLKLELQADWILRTDTTPQQMMPVFETLIHDQTGRDMKFTREQSEKDVIALSGDLGFDRHEKVHLKLTRADGHHSFRKVDHADPGYFADALYKATGIYALDETSREPNVSDISFDCEMIPADAISDDQFIKNLMTSISDPTGLTVKYEKRKVDIWTLEEK